jgi:TPR repeat protein
VIVARMGASWRERSRYHAGELRAIRFSREADDGEPAGSRATLMVTAMATLPVAMATKDPSGGRAVVEQQRASMASKAVEKDPPITDVTVGGARFVSFSVTDASPGKDEHPRATQGVLTLGNLLSAVTILYDAPSTRDELIAALGTWSAFGTPDIVTEPSEGMIRNVEAACQRGDGLACGLQYELSRGDDSKAKIDLLAKGCNAGSAFACGSLGSIYAEGSGVAKDEARARKIFAQGCDAHGWLACYNAAQLAIRGTAEGAPPPPETLRFLERACDHGGDRDGICRFSLDGEAKPAGYLAAQTAGCDQGRGAACHHVGWAIETGYAGATVDIAAARGAYHKACVARSLWGCFREALLTADTQEQARLYEAACAQGSGPACYALAQPAYGRAPAARQDLFRKACESSVQPACGEYLNGLGK